MEHKSAATNSQSIVEEILIDSVWAANKVSFALRTVGDKQFVAYYNKNRMMTVATRKIGSKIWDKKTLPNQLKWDSHNYVTLGIDEKGYLHISGNMHVDSLIYFRSTQPYDIYSLVEVNKMIGQNESDVTYPKFFYDKNQRLYYAYRSGKSGNGKNFINQFDPDAQQWKRYLDKPIFQGKDEKGTRSSYNRLKRDADGNFHYLWMWRWTPDVATCHQLCYATSPDMLNWKNITGTTIPLPFKPDNEQLIVDDVPSKGGLHNSKYELILDEDNHPIIAYLKYDKEGFTQLFVTRFIDGIWKKQQVSNWNFRWKFFGGGDKMSNGASFSLNGFTKEGWLTIDWSNEKDESGVYVVHPETLELIDSEVETKPKYPKDIHSRLTNHPKMSINLRDGSGQLPDNTKYVLKWESMGKSHGRHAPKIIPKGPVSPLKLISIK